MFIKTKSTSKATKLIIIGELILVSYLLYTLTVSVYKSYQIDLIIKDFESENNRIAEDNKKKTEDFEYYTSTNYIEKIAKQNLGLVNPGEDVIVIPIDQGKIIDQTLTADSENKMAGFSNPEKWKVFFFDRER
jgi:cell division protein DivIC